MGKIIIDEDLKELLIHALEKYRDSVKIDIEKKLDILSQFCFRSELKLIRKAMNQITQEQIIALPTIQKKKKSPVTKDLFQSLSNLQTGIVGAIYGFTEEGKMINVIFNRYDGFIIYLENEKESILMTEDIRNVYERLKTLLFL